VNVIEVDVTNGNVILVEQNAVSTLVVDNRQPATIEVTFSPPNYTGGRMIITPTEIQFYASNLTTMIAKMDELGNFWIRGNYMTL
jgi:hypothetical protein